MTGPSSREPGEPEGSAKSEESGESEGTGSAQRRSQAKAYEGAFEAVAAVVIGALLGYWIDTRLDSSPWALLAGVVLGFGAMVLRLLRLGRELGMTDGGPGGGSAGD